VTWTVRIWSNSNLVEGPVRNCSSLPLVIAAVLLGGGHVPHLPSRYRPIQPATRRPSYPPSPISHHFVAEGGDRGKGTKDGPNEPKVPLPVQANLPVSVQPNQITLSVSIFISFAWRVLPACGYITYTAPTTAPHARTQKVPTT
jgi:hypothetical protein